MSNEIVSGLTRLGYLPEGKQRKPTSLINRGMKNAGANVLINNVPEFSIPKIGEQSEKITAEHIYDTIVECGGSPVFVLQVSRHAYIAYVKDGQDIANIMHGNMLDDNMLEVRFFAHSKQKFVKIIEDQDDTTSISPLPEGKDEEPHDSLVSSPLLSKVEIRLCKAAFGFFFFLLCVMYYYQ